MLAWVRRVAMAASIVAAPWFVVAYMIPVLGECQQREERAEFSAALNSRLETFHGPEVTVKTRTFWCALWGNVCIIRIDSLHSRLLCSPLWLVWGEDRFWPQGAKCSICLWQYFQVKKKKKSIVIVPLWCLVLYINMTRPQYLDIW